jgi:hypothetical protein
VGHAAAPATDPDLEPGFPVQAYERAGSYHAGPALNVLVGNIDSDPTLEFLVTALGVGPLYAWNADGAPEPGWPVAGFQRVGYPSLGQLSDSPGQEVFAGHWGFPGKLVAYDGSGTILPGWPRDSANYVDTAAALEDVNGDGVDEIFVEEEDWKLHAYSAEGTILPGWPVRGECGQERHTPAIADLDGDGSPEIVTTSGWTTAGLGICLFAYHADGTTVAGFPVEVLSGYADVFPVIGDVDGDGAPEIVVLGEELHGPMPVIEVRSANGTLERTMNASGTIS